MHLLSRMRVASILTGALLIFQVRLSAQEFVARCDPAPGSLSKLTRTQKQAFMKSQDMFIAGRFADAFGALRDLLTQMSPDTPAHLAIAERTAEAALFAGDQGSAISLLKPIEEKDGSDCPARTLLARAYAETGQRAERDAEIAALVEMHKTAPNSPAGKLDAFLLEQHSLKGGGALTIAYFLRPSGPHNTHILGQVFNASGGRMVTIELDSDDGDQVYFRQSHPDLAAKGEREYSLDGFAESTQPGGSMDHALLQFFDGAPSYDVVRDRIFAIAERASTAEPDKLPAATPPQRK